MNEVDPRISKFIARHHVMTLATSSNNVSYCSNMFYSYLPKDNMLVFTSADHTRHISEVKDNPVVSASVVVESRVVGVLQGIQMCGVMRHIDTLDEELKQRATSSYLRRFPYAVVADLNLWVMELTYLKFTDNKLGFGTKLIWQQ